MLYNVLARVQHLSGDQEGSLGIVDITPVLPNLESMEEVKTAVTTLLGSGPDLQIGDQTVRVLYAQIL